MIKRGPAWLLLVVALVLVLESSRKPEDENEHDGKPLRSLTFSPAC